MIAWAPDKIETHGTLAEALSELRYRQRHTERVPVRRASDLYLDEDFRLERSGYGFCTWPLRRLCKLLHPMLFRTLTSLKSDYVAGGAVARLMSDIFNRFCATFFEPKHICGKFVLLADTDIGRVSGLASNWKRRNVVDCADGAASCVLQNRLGDFAFAMFVGRYYWFVFTDSDPILPLKTFSIRRGFAILLSDCHKNIQVYTALVFPGRFLVAGKTQEIGVIRRKAVESHLKVGLSQPMKLAPLRSGLRRMVDYDTIVSILGDRLLDGRHRNRLNQLFSEKKLPIYQVLFQLLGLWNWSAFYDPSSIYFGSLFDRFRSHLT